METKIQSKIIGLNEIGDEPVGGKARGLKLLIDLGLDVPNGFVLIHPDSTAIDDDLLSTHLERLGKGPKAIRSSAVSEDGEEASFAGQFETFLNINGRAEIQQAIRSCVTAASADRVKHYLQNRISEADLRISVIVQNMVPVTCAGVIFTADPVTHRRDKIIINALEGLGEELVSGNKDAHHYEVFRSGSNLDSVIQSSRHLLTLQQMQQLLEGALKAEEVFGQPVDLEWAIDESGSLFWLQARPITTLNEVHFNELDTVQGVSDNAWTLGNIGEMMPGVTTPLTYSTVVDCIDYGMTVLAARAGACNLKKRDGYRYIQMFYNRLFINLTNMMDYARYSWLNKSENIQLALSVPVNPAIRETTKAPLLLRIFNFSRQSATVIRAASHLKKLRLMAAAFRIDTELPLKELYKKLGEEKAKVSYAFGHHMITSGQSGTLYSAFMGIMTDDKRLPDARDHHIATILLSDIPDIESANAVNSLEFFSHLIRRNETFSQQFVQSTPEEGLRLIREEAPPEISQRYQEFICRHGHRCVRESELREKTWEENQEHLIQLLQTNVRFGNLTHRTIDVKQEIRKALNKLPLHKRFVFRVLLPTARKAVARREISKALAIKMVNELRKGYRALAIKMLDPGLAPPNSASLRFWMMDDEDQIYFLTHEEIGKLIETCNRSVLEKANRRRELLPETDKLQFPEVCFGIPEPIEVPVVPEIKEGQLTGTPVSSGKVNARVRIIHTMDDADKLERGEIMVASFTDIGWTPYFSIISGLITEIGSPLSHGAVVAREYGIPAIVGAKGAKTLLRDGDFVLLDGDRGIVKFTPSF
ncbi:MAG: hypothetical protein ISS17_06105 [Bacteroidales bacterium]|nr:hypothetical protein [Bacteroidales bacterium]